MTLVPFRVEFYEDLVSMFQDFTTEIYGSNRRIGSKYFFYKAVNKWIEDKKDIILCINSNYDIIGFTVSYIDNNGGLTEEVYFGDICYVKPKYRKTRASYLLYKNVVSYGSNDLKLNVVANGRVENGVDKMIEKHFKPIKTFSTYERRK